MWLFIMSEMTVLYMIDKKAKISYNLCFKMKYNVDRD